MILKLERLTYAIGSRFVYIESNHIIMIKLYHKRIRIWLLGLSGCFTVGKTVYNVNKLKYWFENFE